jgi:hypothetical protein
MTDPALQALLDKLQIAELLTRYLRSVDRGSGPGGSAHDRGPKPAQSGG